MRATAPPPAALLGAQHPLARDVESLHVVARDAPTVVVALACGAIAWLDGAPWGAPVVLGAAVALLLLGASAVALHARERTHVRELILDGHERLPLPLVQRERRRLLDPRLRAQLAHSLLEMVGSEPPRAPPVYLPRVVRETEPEIRRLAALLRGEPSGARGIALEPSGARGIALVERLLRDGLSPLYGDDPRPLREELRRLAYLLSR
jgi:hypothetical protein